MSYQRVSCFIDGFNLYHSIKKLGPQNNYLKWINLWSLPSSFIKTSQERVTEVFYFTAYANHREESKKRHEKFIKAISHYGVKTIFGNFKKRTKTCRSCFNSWPQYEEKQSDVNIATYLLHHAYLNTFDKALILSADSDLCHAIELAQKHHTNKKFSLLIPPGRFNITKELRKITSSHQTIKPKHLKSNLLPNIIEHNSKIIAQRPSQYNTPK